MTTPNLPVLADPITGADVELAAPAGVLLDHLERIDALLAEVREHRRAVEAELVRRVDRQGVRTGWVDGCKLEVTPATEDVYEPAAVLAELAPLVEAGTVDAETIAALVVTPEPKPPETRVDRRRVNTLLKGENRELVAALARARRRVSKERRVKVLGRTVEATAQEVTDA